MAEFDPDKYLAKKKAPAGFDPDAYLASKKAGQPVVQPAPEAAQARPGVLKRALLLGSVLPGAGVASLAGSAYEAATGERSDSLDDMHRGVTQGYTLGFGDELTGALGMAAGKDYAVTRDQERAENAAARTRSPKATFLGEMVGGAALPLPGGNATNAGRVALARTLGQGALGGVGMSDATNAKDLAIDGAIGTGSALALHGAGQYALGPLASRLQPVLRRTLNSAAEAQGRRALLNGADSLSSRKPTSPEAVLEAIDSGAIIPGGSTAGNYNRLSREAERVGASYGALVDGLEGLGVRGPVAGDVAADLERRAAQLRPNTMTEALPAKIEEQAALLRTKPRMQVVPTGQPSPGGGQRFAVRRDPRLGLNQAEDLKRSLQNEARYDRIKADPMNEVKEEIASVVRQANEDAITAAGRANPGTDIEVMAEGFVPVKQRLGRLLEARGAAERGAQRGAQRGFFNLGEQIQMSQANDSGLGLIKGLITKTLRERGPSTVAYTARHMAESRALADALRQAPRILPRSAAPVTNAEQEALLQWLRRERDTSARPATE